MLGYETHFERSMNGIKTLTDGKLLIQNGIITDCDVINTKVHNCDNITLKTDGNKIVSNNEFLTLDGINTNTTIQTQIDNILSGISTNIQIVYLGNWNSTTPPYQKGNLVMYNGSVYYCKNNNVTSTSNPSSNTNDWSLFTEKGGTGNTGPQGPQGDTGNTGPKGDKGDDSSLDDLLYALGTAGILGVIIPMALSTLTGRINSIPDIQDDIGDLNNDLNNQDERINALEQKTKYQSALNNVNRTEFNSDVLINYTDPITQTTTTKINLDQSSGSITCNTIEPNNLNANNNIYAAGNLNVVGNATLGTSILSGSVVNLNGLIYINGLPFDYGTGGFNFSQLFNQW